MSDPPLCEPVERARERLQRVLRGPAAIEKQWMFRVAGRLFRLAGWRAHLHTEALTALLSQPAIEAVGITELDAALQELERNLETLERATLLHQRTPSAHALWLLRVCDVLELTQRTLQAEGATRAQLIRQWQLADRSTTFAPLALRPRSKATSEPHVAREDERMPDDAAIDDLRLVDLELAAIDHLIAAARVETALLGRKRRLLVAARQRLLEAAAALPLTRAGVRERQDYLAREIARADRLEAAGLEGGVSLLRQARQALTRRDPQRLHAALRALERNAIGAGDPALHAPLSAALARVKHATVDEDHAAHALLGDTQKLVHLAIRDARRHTEELLARSWNVKDRRAHESFLDSLGEDSGAQILRAAMLADGLFEVGGALAPVRVLEERRVQRLVRVPTQTLELAVAEDVRDLPDSILQDPRSVLLDLAAGRLQTRRFVRDEVHHTKRTVLRGEVRVYVLDGSGSMEGPRSRVRDAILIAELSTLMGRLSDPGDTRCTLFFRYFNEELGPVTRVGSIQEAQDAIRTVVGTPREGGTDIDLALLSSLEQIVMSRREDLDLSSAQIVLITDGEAEVDEAAILHAQGQLEGLPIGVSVIALGQENPALQALVARQRAKGEAAFYHFLDDAQLAAIVAGSGLEDPTPAGWLELEHDPVKLAEALQRETAGLLDDLEHLERDRDRETLEDLELERQARRELGAHVDDDEGLRARFEAAQRDQMALNLRFSRWFPTPIAGETEVEVVDPTIQEDREATCAALSSVAEVVSLLGGTPLSRQADAIELLERLLPDARLTPARYRRVLHEHPHAVASALAALHAAVR